MCKCPRGQNAGVIIKKDFFERAKHASATGAIIKRLRSNIRLGHLACHAVLIGDLHFCIETYITVFPAVPWRGPKGC